MERKTDINLPLGTEQENVWTKGKLEEIKAFIAGENAKRTDKQRLETELLAVKLQMEDYLENREINLKKLYSIDRFLNLHLNAIGLSFKKFAESIDTSDSNLKKYLSGDRKFNPELAMKFGSFFHNGPNLWMNIQIKNEMIVYAKKMSEFKKYDYRKVLKNEKGTKSYRTV